MLKKMFIVGLLILATTNLSALPVSVQKDMYLKELATEIKDKDYENALKTFSKLDTLIEIDNIDVPNSYYYFKAETLFHQKKYILAEEQLEQYFTLTGTKGRYYEDALQYMIKIKKAKKEKYNSQFIIEHNGLLYQSFKVKEDEDKYDRYLTWEDGEKYCKNLDLNGKGWRLPTVREVLSMSNITPFAWDKDYHYELTYHNGRYSTKAFKWYLKHRYLRVQNPTQKLNIDIEKAQKSFNNYYIFIKNKFIKELTTNDARIGRVFTSEVFTSQGYNGLENLVYSFSFSKGRLERDFQTNKRFIMCVKDK